MPVQSPSLSIRSRFFFATPSLLLFGALAACNEAGTSVQTPSDRHLRDGLVWQVSGSPQYDVVGAALISTELVHQTARAAPLDAAALDNVRPHIHLITSDDSRDFTLARADMNSLGRPRSETADTAPGQVVLRFDVDLRTLIGPLKPGPYRVCVSSSEDTHFPAARSGPFSFDVIDLDADGFVTRETPAPQTQNMIVLDLHEARAFGGTGLARLGPATILNRSEDVLYFSAIQRYESDDAPYHVEAVWESYDLQAGWIQFPNADRAIWYFTPEIEPGAAHALFIGGAPNHDGWHRVKFDCYLLDTEKNSSTRVIALSQPRKIDNFRPRRSAIPVNN